ncbi:MAG: AAA family ATPase [Nocardioidaceae bacterium]
MGAFIDTFRERFPHQTLPEKWLGSLAPPDGPEPTYLSLRLAPLLALETGLDAGVQALRSVTAPGPVADRPGRGVIEAAAVLCNQAIAEGEESVGRTRRIVDLMLSQDDPQLMPVAAAFAAVMHARVSDDRLTELRLEDVMTLLNRGGIARLGELDVRLMHHLTNLAVDRIAGDSRFRLVDSPVLSPEGEAQDLLWGQLLGRPALDSSDRQPLAGVILRLPRGGLLPVVMALPGLVFDAAVATGRGGDLAPLVAPALDAAEQLLWGALEPRSLLWSRIAMTWAGIGRHDRAMACVREAWDSIPGDVDALLPGHEQVVAADLLEVVVRSGTRAPAHAAEPPPPLSPASPPFHATDLDALAPVLAAGGTVLIAGAAIPEARGVDSVVELMRSFVRSAEQNARMSTSSRSLIAGIEQGQLNQVGAALRAGQFPFDAMVREAYDVLMDQGLYGDLASIPFASVLTLAWDRQLLDAFAHRDPLELHVGSSTVLDAAKSQQFAFTWLAGDPAIEQVAIGMRDIRSRLYGDETLSRYLTGLLGRSPLLFLGMTSAEVVEFLDTVLPFGTATSTSTGDDGAEPPRFAVCPVDDLWELSRAQLQDQYGVHLLGFDAHDPTALAAVIRHLSDRASHSGVEPPRPQRTQPTLTRIALENIGAFEHVELRLNDAWNVMLGNNGCGKSTILRAVALGLCGDHPQAVEAGASLLRAGTTRGSIELDIGPSRFRTDLTRSGPAVRVRNHSLTPLQEGSWAVLGFPALRGLSMSTGSGITHGQAPEPRVEDLLPLLRGDVDQRMDDIKQWIINVDARSRDADGPRWRRLLERFFEVVKNLTPGGTLEFDRVDPSAWEVWVRTDDGVVSVDQLSQGMSSIIAWVGNVLQRMYDIYPASEDPAGEPAVVLIDELDAHLHPEWQRLVPSLTREHFPNVQFLATSHSPLIAGSLRPGELFVARRLEDPGSSEQRRRVATIQQYDLDPQGLRADQILTSPLFNMMSSRSPEFENDAARYRGLLTAEDRSPADEREFQRLQSQISSTFSLGETPQDREAEQRRSQIQADVRAQLANLDPDQQALLQQLVENAEPSSSASEPEASGTEAES